MIKPTIGRVVWFWPKGLERLLSDQPHAAIVAYVHQPQAPSERYELNILEILPTGLPVARNNVPLMQPEDHTAPRGPYCEWMPFQKGQAAGADTRGVTTHAPLSAVADLPQTTGQPFVPVPEPAPAVHRGDFPVDFKA